MHRFTTVFFLNLYMYGLCIMIRHNVIFCTKNDSRFMPLTIYSIADDENEFKTIFISVVTNQKRVSF